jgi:hypothetical protein
MTTFFPQVVKNPQALKIIPMFKWHMWELLQD